MSPELLTAWAEKELEEVLGELPEDIRVSASECPVRLLMEPTPLQREEMGEEVWGLLGLFEGCSRMEGFPSSPDQVPRISLFLDTLWEEAEEDRSLFCEEVRITYLHELGHYLGWDEEQVESYGL